MQREREKSQRLFDIDIERSFRDWMAQLGGDPDVMAHGEPTEPDFDRQLDLTQRERECLTLYACGYTKRQVGEHLHISMETVKQYTKRCTHKLGASTTGQAAFIAALVGELDLDLLREHLFRAWESGGPAAAPRTPIAA